MFRGDCTPLQGGEGLLMANGKGAGAAREQGNERKELSEILTRERERLT